MMSDVFGGSRSPKPDFWDLVMLYTHRDDLQTLSCLDQITCDVGRCRAWVRLVINDGTLSSFIGEQSTGAFIQDAEIAK